MGLEPKLHWALQFIILGLCSSHINPQKCEKKAAAEIVQNEWPKKLVTATFSNQKDAQKQ